MKQLLLAAYKKAFAIFSGHGIGMLPVIRQINEFAVSKLRQDFAIVQGHKMFLDANDSLNLSTYGFFEKLETKLIKKEVREGNVALDLGAHIGYFTLLLARQVGAWGKVFAFEPDPNNFALLKKNIETNGYKNVVLEQKAVSDKNGKIKMYINNLNRTLPSIYNLHNSNEHIKAEAVSLDSYLKGKNQKIDFIKMDIEGAEFLALKGMQKILEKNKELKMIIEFGPEMLNASWVDPQKYLEFVASKGFALNEIDEEKNRIVPTTAAELLKKYPLEKLKKMPKKTKKSTNLLCIKSAKK